LVVLVVSLRLHAEIANSAAKAGKTRIVFIRCSHFLRV
jgi:hypothetical protein